MVNGPTPSEFSFGRGSRPSRDLYPQPDPDFDQLALIRAERQTDSMDPAAVPDWEGTLVTYDEWGRQRATLAERGGTPIVRETGVGAVNDRLDPTNPKAYEDLHGRRADPNEAWRDEKVRDPIRVDWENEQYDAEVNARTAAYDHGTGDNAKLMSEVTYARDAGKHRRVKRTPESKRGLFRKNGEPAHDDNYNGGAS